MRGRPAPKRPSKPSVSCSSSMTFCDLLPLDAERRVGEHVVEAPALRGRPRVKELPSTMCRAFCPLISMSDLQIA